MRTVQKNIVGALIVSKDGKILQGLKEPNEKNIWPHCWHIPGGALEEGESWEHALVRELKEEVGLDVSSYPLELIDGPNNFSGEKTLKTGERVMQDMTGRVYKIILDQAAADVQVVLGDNEFAEFAWHTPEDLKNVKVTPPSVILFKKLGYL